MALHSGSNNGRKGLPPIASPSPPKKKVRKGKGKEKDMAVMKAFFQSRRSEWAVSYRDDEWVALYEVASSHTSAGFGGLNKWSDELKRPVRCEIVMCPILGIGSFLAASGHRDGLDVGLHATRATQRQSYEMPGAILGRGFILVQTGTGVQAEPRANRNGGNKRRQNTCLLLRLRKCAYDRGLN